METTYCILKAVANKNNKPPTLCLVTTNIQNVNTWISENVVEYEKKYIVVLTLEGLAELYPDIVKENPALSDQISTNKF